jgi:cytoskeleton-associated protein 5
MSEKLTFTGCYDLADVEESFVLLITRAGKGDPNRLNTLINRSYRVCV